MNWIFNEHSAVCFAILFFGCLWIASIFCVHWGGRREGGAQAIHLLRQRILADYPSLECYLEAEDEDFDFHEEAAEE